VPCAKWLISGRIYAASVLGDRRQAPPLIASSAVAPSKDLARSTAVPDTSGSAGAGPTCRHPRCLALAPSARRRSRPGRRPLRRGQVPDADPLKPCRTTKENGRPLRGGHLDA